MRTTATPVLPLSSVTAGGPMSITVRSPLWWSWWRQFESDVVQAINNDPIPGPIARRTGKHQRPSGARVPDGLDSIRVKRIPSSTRPGPLMGDGPLQGLFRDSDQRSLSNSSSGSNVLMAAKTKPDAILLGEVGD
ncbi:MAG: hypothetical protein M1837_002890 [Sclerophora amabilis]|nr:MAG: hypothetical protein M1837_002890 [Sclerophora amabilis]